MNKILTMAILVYGGMSRIQAQTDSLRHYSLEGTIVTATRSEEYEANVARSVTVITQKEIAKSASHSLGELLRQVEGIYMTGTQQTPGSIQNVFMRGANSNHTVIMVDGMRIGDPSSVDNALDLSEVSLVDVERIEIVRGAHSTLYGTSAIGGVVNIITKKNGERGFNAYSDLQSGYFGKGTSILSQNVFMNYSFRNGFYVNADVFHSDVTGINAAVDTVKSPGVYKNFDNDGFRKLDWVGKTGYKNEQWDLFISYKNVNQKSDLDAGAFVDDPNYKINFHRDFLNYGASYRINKQLNFSYLGGYSSMKRKAINDSNTVDTLGNFNHSYFRGDYSGTLNNNELQSNFRLQNVEWVAGVGRYKETTSTKTFILSTDPLFPYSISSNLDTLGIHSVIYNAFVRSDIQGDFLDEELNAFSLGLGGRWNHHSAYGNNFTYEINPSYRLTDHTLLFASYATGFNAPSLYRLFTPETYYTSNIQRGNKNLKPETSVSYEFGIKQMLDDIRFSVSVFHTTVKNYIDFVYLWDKNISIDTLGNDFLRDDYRGDTYLNIGEQVNNGMEAGIQARVNSRLNVFGNVTLIRGKLNYDASKIDTAKTQGNHVQLYSNGAFLTQGTQSSKLVRRPNNGNFGLTYEMTKSLSVTAVAQYTGTRRDVFYDVTLAPYGALASTPLKSYWTLDISSQWAISKQWIATLRIDNVLNEKITEIRGFRNRGRGFLLSLRSMF